MTTSEKGKMTMSNNNKSNVKDTNGNYISPFNDCTRLEALDNAKRAIEQSPVKTVVHYKWTCPACGFRNMVRDKNYLPLKDRCDSCDKESAIHKAGFALIMDIGAPLPNNEPAYTISNGKATFNPKVIGLYVNHKGEAH